MVSGLVGTWQKVTRSRCSETYPDELEFRANGIYFGRRGDSGQEFTVWDAGGYRVLGGDRVRISTANDAQIAYEFSLSGGVLRFVAPDGCRFEYRRAD